MFEYDIQMKTQYGWEVVTCEETFPGARERIKEYRENQPGYSYRIKKVRRED